MNLLTQNEARLTSLYFDNQQKVISYARTHHAYMAQCFAELKQNSDDEDIKVDKVFDYLKNAFNQDEFHFQNGISGPNILVHENIQKIQQLLQRFYMEFKKIPSDQFYFYRLAITEDEIADLIEFWIRTEDRLFIQYEKVAQNNQQHIPILTSHNKNMNTLSNGIASGQLTTQNSENNEFISVENSLTNTNNNLIEEIHQKEGELLKSQNQLQRIQIQATINRPQQQVETIQNNSNKPPLINFEKKTQEIVSPDRSPTHNNISLIKDSAEMRKINIKILFEYYCKQNHITGIKATFDRIQHESTTINYPKLIHLLKDSNLIDDKEKTNIFSYFQKAAADYKTLQHHQFEQLLIQLSHILITEDIPSHEKEEKFFNRIFSSEHHSTKLNFQKRPKFHGTGKAFNTREGNDFRIKAQEIKYQFHIIPHSGKTSNEIQEQLHKRRENKEKYKLDLVKQKEVATQRFLKKLSSIDPFNSSLVNLKQENKQQHMAGINNLEAFRDASFNPKEFFKIAEENEDDTFVAKYSFQGLTQVKHSSIRFKHKQPSDSLRKESPHKESPRKNRSIQSPHKDKPLESPRIYRAKSIAEEISARAIQIQKIQKSKNQLLMKSILNSQHLQRKATLGGISNGGSEKNRRY